MERPAFLTGDMAGDVGFDPLGFVKSEEDLRQRPSSSSQHSKTSVLDLGLAVVHEVLLTLYETKGIKSNITSHISGEEAGALHEGKGLAHHGNLRLGLGCGLRHFRHLKGFSRHVKGNTNTSLGNGEGRSSRDGRDDDGGRELHC